MIIEPVKGMASRSLTSNFVQEAAILAVVITGEPTLQKFTVGKNGDRREVDKIVCPVSYQGQQPGMPDQWILSAIKGRNSMIDLYGSDTNKWIGQTVDVMLVTSGGYTSIEPNPVACKARIAQQQGPVPQKLGQPPTVPQPVHQIGGPHV